MEIRELAQETYAGRKFTARYQTHGYYDIRAAEDGFRVEYRPFAAAEERSFEDVFFGEWLEDPVAFGAFEDGELLGYVEGSPETWNRRLSHSFFKRLCLPDMAQQICSRSIFSFVIRM